MNSARAGFTTTLTMKTKHLAVAQADQIPHGAENATFDAVDIGELNLQRPAGAEFYELLGHTKATLMHNHFNSLLLISDLNRLKTSKSYKAAGLTWEQVCREFGLSVDTVDRKIRDLQDSTLGPVFLKLNDILGVSRELYRAISPKESEDGKLVIGGQALEISARNAPTLKAAFQAQQEQLQSLQTESANTKQALKEAREQRDNAKKAAVEAHKKLRDSQSDKAFADADEDHKVMLRAQSSFDFAMVLLAKLRDRELSEENSRRYVGLAHKMYRELLESLDAAKVSFERTTTFFDPTDPSFRDWLDTEPDQSRNLLAEYIQREGETTDRA